jgi:bacterioferritin
VKEKIIGLLNKDLEGEHAAIIQYLTHAYSMGEGEMRTGGQSVANWMRNNVLQEQDAIAMYQEHIQAIADPRIRRLLERILSDEKSHRGDFDHFADKAQKQGLKDLRGSRRDKAARTLNWGIEHEYTVVLQYLLHSYLASNDQVKKEMEDQAINEMQHLGWLSEELVGKGGRPRIEHTEVDKSRKTADMLRADIKIEQEVAAEYDRAARETKDQELRELLLRIRDHEVYHADLFSDLLKKEERHKSAGRSTKHG